MRQRMEALADAKCASAIALAHGAHESQRSPEVGECAPMDVPAGLVFWHVEPATGRLHTSASLETLFGHRDGDIGDRPADYLRVVHPGDRRRVVSAWRAAASSATSTRELEFRAIGRDGAQRQLAVASATTRDTSNESTVVCGSVRDVTAARQAEAALRASEALYRSLVQCQTEVVSLLMPDGTLVFVNEAYCTLFGKPMAELIGHRWNPIAHPADVSTIEAQLRSMSPARPIVVIDNRVFIADGSVRWMQFVNRGEYDAAGRLKAIHSVGRDLTPLKTVEEQLRESQERLTLALAGAAQVTWDWDMQARRIQAPQAWQELLGRQDAPTTIDEADCLALIHPDDLRAFQERLQEHLLGNTQTLDAEHRLRHADGHWLQVETRGKVTRRNDNAQPLRMVGTWRDVTHQRRLQDEGIRLLKQIESLISSSKREESRAAGVPEGMLDLTRRERQILVLVAKGLSSAEIALKLHLSTNTIASHRRAVMSKVGARSSVDLARLVYRHGLDNEE